ncbi:MAG TPA: DUF2252 family protein [Myxococcales bacterium]|nr:DUF2252 family protein [Myxococcales bacterium]
MSRDAFEAILDYNQRFVGRDPDLLPHKMRKMAKHPFAFFRGTFHLFAADWVSGLCDPWRDGRGRERDPVVGDVHIESFGAHEAQDGTIVFSIQDLDEAAELDYDLDVFRAAASAALAVDQAGLPLGAACTAAACFAEGYADEAARLAEGKDEPSWIVARDLHAPAPVQALCDRLAAVSRQAFLEEQCEPAASASARLRRNERHLEIRQERTRAILEGLAGYLRTKAGRAGPTYLPVDVVYRVAGTGGLGRYRYAVLLAPEGGSAGAEVLLEVKETTPAALDLHRGHTQADQAERVVRRTAEAQGRPNAWLGYTRIGSQPYQIREIGPHDGHLSPAGFPDAAQAEAVLECCGRLLAATHHRSHLATQAGRCDPPATRLRDRHGLWLRRAVSFGLFYAALVQEDHRAFVARLEEALSRLTPRA